MKIIAGFFVLAALLPPLDFVDMALKGVPHLLAKGPIYLIIIPLITVLRIFAIAKKIKTFTNFLLFFS